jgi:hypothetical protein
VIVVDDLGLMIDRLLNPAVVLALVLSGVAYGGFLWTVHIRPNLTLWALAVLPGGMFIVVIGVVRMVGQDSTSTLYPVLLIAWLVFANSGVLTVLVARRWRRRKGTL